MTNYEKPFVSVVAPCRNESGFVGKAIETILQNDYPEDLMEVLVIDGMSSDGTRDIVKAMMQQDSRIRLIDNPKKIVPSAMNIAIRESRGDYIIRIDCHSSFAPDYISKCIEVSRRTKAENVGGYWITLPGANTDVARAIAAATSCGFGVGNAMFRLAGQEREVDTVPFGTYRRSIFEQVGYYDERLVRNQDIELNSRIRKAGGKIVISPEIKLNYYNRATYSGLWQQSFNNGLWNPYTIWLVGSGLYLRHFVPMFFVLGLVTFIIGAFFWWFFKWILLGYILFYLSTATVFSIRSARRTKTSAILVLWSFVVLHVAYGLGSLWAVITIPFKFPNRHKRTIGKPLTDRKT